jgi:hypothetical protein
VQHRFAHHGQLELQHEVVVQLLGPSPLLEGVPMLLHGHQLRVMHLLRSRAAQSSAVKHLF